MSAFISFLKSAVFLLFLTLPFGSCIAQHTYYFRSKPNGKQDGTKVHPYLLRHGLSSISLEAGDTVFFHGEDTIKGNIILKHINGSQYHPIVFASYGKGKAIIDARNKEALEIKNSSHFFIKNLKFTGTGRKNGNTTNGIKLVNCNNLIIDDLDISGFQKAGLLLYDCVKAEVHDVYAHRNGAVGIYVNGDYQKRNSKYIHLVDCRAENNPGDPTNLTNNSGNGILVGNCRKVLIEYCTATNNGWDMPRIGAGPVGIWAYEADSVTIQHCISYKNKTAHGAADGGGFDLDGGVTNSVIQYCLSYDNWGSGYSASQYLSASNWYNNTVRYCISINDGNITDHTAAMYVWNGWSGDSTFTDFYAYNNFIYSGSKYALGFSRMSRHKRFYFFNNVFISSDTSSVYSGIDSSHSDLMLGNIWMKKDGGFMQNGFTDLKKWSLATGFERKEGKLMGTTFQKKLFSLPLSIDITNPRLLKSNTLLQSLCSNKLKNKGIDISKLFDIDVGESDFFGNQISQVKEYNPGVCEMN